MAAHPGTRPGSNIADRQWDETRSSQKRGESFDIYGASPAPPRQQGRKHAENEFLESFVRRSTRPRVHSTHSDMKFWDEIGEEEIGIQSESESRTESNDDYSSEDD